MLGPEDTMPSRIRDHHVVVSGPRRGCWFAIAAAVLFVLPIVAWTAPQQKGLTGTFTLVKDSDGTTPKAKATVTLTFHSGVVSVSAVQPGETVEDTGTYVVAGNLITITFKEMEWEANKQPFTFNGCTLTLPFKALSATPGPGTSTWISQEPGCAPKPAANPGPATPAGQGRPEAEKPAPPSTQTRPFNETVNAVADAIRAEIRGRKEALRPEEYDAMAGRLSKVNGIEDAEYAGDTLGTFYLKVAGGGVLTWRHVTNDLKELETLPAEADFSNCFHPKWNKGWKTGDASGGDEESAIEPSNPEPWPPIQPVAWQVLPGQLNPFSPAARPQGQTNTYATHFPMATGNPDPEYRADAAVSCAKEGSIAMVDFQWTEAQGTLLYTNQFNVDGAMLYDRIKWMGEAAGFDVRLFKDDEINLTNFKTLQDYSVVILIGHGARPAPKPSKRLGVKFTQIITAEKYDPKKTMYGMTYEEAWKKGYLTYDPASKVLDWTPMLFRDLYRPAKDQLFLPNECWAMLPLNVGLVKDEKGKFTWWSGVTGSVYNIGDGLMDAGVKVVFGYISPATPKAIVYNLMNFFRRLFGGYFIKDAPPAPHIFWPTCMSAQTFFRMPGTPRLPIYGNRYYGGSAYTMYAVDDPKFFRSVCSPSNQHAYLQSFMLRVGTPATALTNCWNRYWSHGQKVTEMVDKLCGQGDYPTTEKATQNAACAVKIARQVTNAMLRK
jgi:hypothetical protein